MPVSEFPSPNEQPGTETTVVESTVSSVTTQTLTVAPYRGPKAYCDNVKTEPTGVEKPVNCTFFAVYDVTSNGDAVQKLCPQCTTAVEMQFDSGSNESVT